MAMLVRSRTQRIGPAAACVVGLAAVLAWNDARAATSLRLSVAGPDGQPFRSGDEVTVTVRATFDQVMAACEYRLTAGGTAGAVVTQRSVANALTYLSTIPADPFGSELPRDLVAAGQMHEVLVAMRAVDRPGTPDDGIAPGTNVALATYKVRVSGAGTLTLAVAAPVAAAQTQTNPNGALFDSVGIEAAAGSITVIVTPGPDLDGDGDVDITDFGVFQRCFNGPNRPPSQNDCGPADLDGDADVDPSDFLVFQRCFNGPNRPPRPQ